MDEAREGPQDWWAQELALVEGAAIRIEGLEATARVVFERHRERLIGGDDTRLRQSHEFKAWIQARHDTDAAWGRWYEVMAARPPA